MKIRAIGLSDVDKIAILHRVLLPNTISSKLGISYLRKLYSIVFSYPEIHTGFLAEEADSLVGVIFGTVDLAKTQKTLRRLLPQTVFLCLVALIFGRIKLGELIDRIKFERLVLQKFGTPYPTILTLFVVRDCQRKGIGRRLVKYFLRQHEKEGITKIYVDTLGDNHVALAFYQALGFVVKERIADSIVLEYGSGRIKGLYPRVRRGTQNVSPKHGGWGNKIPRSARDQFD